MPEKLLIKVNYLNAFSLIWLLTATVASNFAVADQIYLAKVSVDEAARNVNKDRRSRVLGARTKIIDGREVHVIKTLSDKGRIKNRRVDAETGKTLKKNNRR